MKRKALIIGAPDEKIPGVKIDMTNLRYFLQSYAGGAWHENEITTLECPDRHTLHRQLESLKDFDYSFVSFAGHGAYSQTDRTTHLELNRVTKIDVDELKIGAPRRTVLIDSCRVLTKASLYERIVKASASLESLEGMTNSRKIFDDHLKRCPAGLATLYSCSIGETADETAEDGGFYTSAVVTSGQDFSSDRYLSSGVLTISDAHEVAKGSVRKRSGQSQNPTAELPRALPHFPFAIR